MKLNRWITHSFRSWVGITCVALLPACGGNGNGSGGGAPVVPARAGSADIDSLGGSVGAVLEGGTTVELVVPSRALATTTTLRIDPVVAPDGTLGEFTIAPSDIVLQAPVTLIVTLPAGTNVDADVTLAIDTGTGQVPMDTELDLAGRTLTLHLSELPSAAASRAAPASVGRARAQALGPVASMRLAIVRMDYGTRLAVLNAVANNLVANGSSDNATIVQLVMNAVLRDTRGAAELRVHTAAGQWAGVVCAQQQFNVSALNTFAGSDIQTFEQQAKDVFVWDRHALALNTTVARLAPAEAGCTGVPADFAEPVRLRLPVFLDEVRQALDTLDPEVAAELSQLTGVRLVELLNLAADFAAIGLVDLQNAVVFAVSAELDHLRAIAYASCRGRRDQTLQARLISAMSADTRLNALVPEGWDQRLAEDVQFCGMALHWKVVDAQGAVLQQGDAGGIAPGDTTTRASLRLAGAAKVVFSGPLAALVCPLSSQNNEQLVFSTGPAAGPPTGAQPLTPSNANGYLESSSLDFDVATLQAQGIAQIRIARQGGVCSGDFLILTAHAPIATFALDATAAAPEIITSSLRGGTVGFAYQFGLQATGGTPPLTWSATGLPAGLSLNPGTGAITGSPTSAGTSPVTIELRSADGATARVTLSVAVVPNVQGFYVGTRTRADVGVPDPFSATIGQNLDLVAFGGFLCRLAPDGTLTYLGDSIGWVAGGGPLHFTVVGRFAGATLTISTADLPPRRGGLDVSYVLVKQ